MNRKVEIKMNKRAFAVACHPDDIEFLMAGTLLLLGQAGYELHYMNVANGSAGSVSMGSAEIARVRTEEARESTKILDATFHEPITDDLTVFHTPELIAKLTAVMREVSPTILLLPSPQDYMEDHMNTSRLGVTAAFSRNIPNYKSDPPVAAVMGEMAVYHGQPAGLCDQLRNFIQPDFFVNVTDVTEKKRDALACHRSQKEWLDATQGMDSYLKTMENLSLKMGQASGCFQHAEGWRRHDHLGFSASPNFDPLCDALGSLVKQS